MPRHNNHLEFAINTAKYWCKRAKTDTERRWWFTRYIVLSGLVKIQLDDTSVIKRGQQPTDEVHEQVRKMMDQLGGDDAGATKDQFPDGNRRLG